MEIRCWGVSIPFRADTGFERVTCDVSGFHCIAVSIPFRADTGFELNQGGNMQYIKQMFQSLSGLTLGLNFNHGIFLCP